MQRVFAISMHGNDFILSEEDSFHLQNVVRLRMDENIEVIYDGHLYEGKVTRNKPLLISKVKELESIGELPNDITLYFVYSKGDKNDLVVQKATELGVNHIVFISSKYEVAIPKDFEKKKERFEKIAYAATMQCKRMKVPSIEGIVDINKLIKTTEYAFYAYEVNKGKTKDSFDYFNKIKPGESVSVLIGSEGGIAPSEASNLNKNGFVPISLGKRILRAETAAINVLSVLSFLLEK